MRGRYAGTLAIKQLFTHINEKTHKSSGYIFNFTKPQKDLKLTKTGHFYGKISYF